MHTTITQHKKCTTFSTKETKLSIARDIRKNCTVSIMYFLHYQSGHTYVLY